MNGAPQKPTTACSGRKFATHDRDRFEQRGERLFRLGHAQPLDRGESSDRICDDGPDPFDELDVEPHSDHRGHDVGEHHGRVDAVPEHGLQRHLGTELRRVRDLPERVARPHRPILGQRPSSLPHEPHRCALDRLAPGGAHE